MITPYTIKELFNEHVNPIDAPVGFSGFKFKVMEELISSFLHHESKEEVEGVYDEAIDQLAREGKVLSVIHGLTQKTDSDKFIEAQHDLTMARNDVIGTQVMERLELWVNTNKEAKYDDLRLAG